MKLPRIGDQIYVPTQWSIDHGESDIQGGQATVKEMKEGISGGETIHFIEVYEIPNCFNWEHYLSENQEKWKKEFGDEVARCDPDYG